MNLYSRAFVLTVSFVGTACTGSTPIPVQLIAEVEPGRLWYQNAQEIELQATVLDQFGESIREDVEVLWEVDPAAAATEESEHEDPRHARFTLRAEGVVTFTGCVVPEVEGDPPVCDSVTVRVDDGAPTIELETPSPGAQVEGADGIAVRGSISDGSSPRVYVNGAAVEVDDLGVFETVVPARFGVNHLEVSASDGVTEGSVVEGDVIWASRYSPAVNEEGTPELRIEDGIRLWLGPPFFDDGMPLEPASDPLVTHDMADLIELILSEIDVGSLIENPVVDMAPTFTLSVDQIAISQPEVTIELTDRGAEVFVRIGRIDMDTAGFLVVESTSLPLEGHVTASAVAFANLRIIKVSESGPVHVTLNELTVGIEQVDGTFSNAETTAVFRLAEGLLRTSVEEVLAESLDGSLRDSIPETLRDVLGAIDTALMDVSVPLAAEPFPPVTIQIDGRMRELRTLWQTELETVLRTTVGTTSTAVHPDSPGVARLDAFDDSPRLFLDGSMKLAVRLAFLNGLLHALWNSGMLSFDATPLLPSGVTGLVSEARLEGRLPPILRPPSPEESDDLVLSLGQLELDLTFMGAPARYAVSVEAGVQTTVLENRIAVTLAEEPTLRVWTLVAPEDERLLNEGVVTDLLMDLWPSLRTSLTSGLSFEVPLPALGDLGGLTPGLSDFSLQVDMVERSRTRGGTLVVDASMVGTFPSP